MAELTPERRVELVDVVEALHGTFATQTTDGVKIDEIRGFIERGVEYSDQQTGESIRKMSATAYAAEFYKICGNSLDEADFDEVMSEFSYVGGILGSLTIDAMEYETVRAMAGAPKEKPVSKRPLPDTRPHVWGEV